MEEQDDDLLLQEPPTKYIALDREGSGVANLLNYDDLEKELQETLAIEKWKLGTTQDLQPLDQTSTIALTNFLRGRLSQNQFPQLWNVFLAPLKRVGSVSEDMKAYRQVTDRNSLPLLSELEKIIAIDLRDNFDEYKAHLLHTQAIPIELRQAFDGITYEQIVVVFAPLLERIHRELAKYEEVTSQAAIEPSGSKYKAYISKNEGSFFAKAAVGICTAEDIGLFNRKNYFHINIVENDEKIVANVQAYVLSIRGKKTLLLRGFNQTSSWKEGIENEEGFCEAILEIGRQFAESNHIDLVTISPQEGEWKGTWHALANRDSTAHVLKKYQTPERTKKIGKSFSIAENRIIREVYVVHDLRAKVS